MPKITLLKKKTEVNEKTKEKIIVKEEKVYEIPYVSAAAYLEYVELEAQKENPELIKVEDVKKLVPLIVKTYEGQFTEEEFFEGVPGYKLMETLDGFIASLNQNPYPTKNDGELGNEVNQAN